MTRFTQDLLCGRDFFPERNTPITGFQRENEDVKRAADELYDSRQAVAPQGSDDPEPWPAYPRGEQFSALLARGKDRYPRLGDGLGRQHRQPDRVGRRRRLPTLDWELMRARDRATPRGTGPLVQVQAVPRQQVMRFDVCFLKFTLDGDGVPIVRVPKA